MKVKSTGHIAKSASLAQEMSFFSWRVKISPGRPRPPVSIASYHGFRKTTEDYGGERDCVAAQGRGDHCGGGGGAQRKNGGGTGGERPFAKTREFGTVLAG